MNNSGKVAVAVVGVIAVGVGVAALSGVFNRGFNDVKTLPFASTRVKQNLNKLVAEKLVKKRNYSYTIQC